jgi:hypothetical protein
MKSFFIKSDSFSGLVNEFIISDIELDRTYSNFSDEKIAYCLQFDFTTGHRSFTYRTNSIINKLTGTFTVDDVKFLTSRFSDLMIYIQEEITKLFTDIYVNIYILNLDEIVNHFLQLNSYGIK